MSLQTELRPLTPADIPAWNELLAAAEAVDQTGEHFNEADLAEQMTNPEIEVGKDIVGAFDGDVLVGYYGVMTRGVSAGRHRIILEGTVRPELRDRGVGTRLCEAMRARGLAYSAERHPGLVAELSLTGLASNSAQERLMATIGLVPDRWNFCMRAQLDESLPSPSPLAEGLELHTYDDSFADAMFVAHNTAFLDHPNFIPWTDTMWQQWVTGSRNFRPALSFVVAEVSRPGEVVGYVQSYEYDAYFEQTGRREAYVGKVGTLREHRGRGLASAMLSHALRAYRAAGFDEASLDVDSDNPTGALGVYHRAGFEVESRWTNYAGVVTP